MKHIHDDTNYAKHMATNNELARKKMAIDAEVDQLRRELAEGSGVSDPQDAVEIGLAIEAGKPSSDGGAHAKRDRLSILQTQSDQLRKAIYSHSLKVEQAQRTAAYRVFSANCDTYLRHADQLVKQVESIIATSNELKQDHRGFYERGVAEPPLIVFPEYGFSEQLPEWLEMLIEAVRRARLVQQTYAVRQKPHA